MYEVQPKKTNNLAANLSLVLIFGGILAMYFSSLPSIPFRPVMQTVSLLIIAFAIMLLGRYVFKSFSYSIVDTEGDGLDFTVTELKRRSRITLTRVSLSGISEIIPLKSDAKEIMAKKKKGRKSFNYCVDLCPKESYLILCEECGEKYAIRISADEKLITLLSEYHPSV